MRFLAFEGLDGSGKSTLAKGLEQELEACGQSFVTTREPGGTALGDDIRQLLLRTNADAPVARAEALLYQASRAQHVENLIRPALKRGDWVLSDRFAASSLAFQSEGRSIARAEIEWLNRFATAGLEPDLYVLLDLSAADSAARICRRGEAADRMEQEDRAFHERVRSAYLELAERDPARWLVLSAERSPQELQAQLRQRLRDAKWLA